MVCLPIHPLIDILCRLPVKSLLRFKSVCKVWNFKIISHHSFQAVHRERSQRRSPRFLLRFCSFNLYPQLDPAHRFVYKFDSMDTEGNTLDSIQVKLQEPIKLVLPGCFGLVCLATETSIHVCNPSTRQLVVLPEAAACDSQSSLMVGFGIGYLSSMKTHKIVRLMVRGRRKDRIECSIFALAPRSGGEELGSWRVLQDEVCPYLVEEFSVPAFANETIYWKINRHGHHGSLQRDNDFIVAFNVRHEKFETITHPDPADETLSAHPYLTPNWEHTIRNSTQLVELQGDLCMVQTRARSDVAIWALRNRNRDWLKVRSIDITSIHPNYIGEVQCIKNGEIIFNSSTRMMLYYHLRKNTFRHKILPFPAANLTCYSENLSIY